MVVGAALEVPAVVAVGPAGPVAAAAGVVSVVAAVALLVVPQVLALRLGVVSGVGRHAPVPAVVAAVARPVPSAGQEAPRARAASPSGRSGRSSTTCRRRRWAACGCL